mgnify:CR=1 FL=1
MRKLRASEVKWDGCSHLNFGHEGYIHTCNPAGIKQIGKILETVYLKCGQIMRRENEEQFASFRTK